MEEGKGARVEGDKKLRESRLRVERPGEERRGLRYIEEGKERKETEKRNSRWKEEEGRKQVEEGMM